MRAVLVAALVALASATATAKPKPFPVTDDCRAICKRALSCKVGPWTKSQDCVDACESSNEDPAESGKTYACIGKAQSCSQVRKCGN